MFLDTVNTITNTKSVADMLKQPAHVYTTWENFPYSAICHHGTACCDIAKEWLIAMDFSQLNGSSTLTGPRWLRQRWDWGPSSHPIHWCEAVKAKKLDCGAQAALAYECFVARGVKAFPVQLVQRYSSDAVAHWREQWEQKEVSTHWLNQDVIYHEGCAIILEDNSIKVWDASAAWWIHPTQYAGYGSLLALKIHTFNKNCQAIYRWGDHKIYANKWQTL